MLINDWTPVGLYSVGMVGFVAAGLGLLGLRPLDRAISPLLVVASGLSLVAIVRFADPSLWFGGACDIALLMLGLWRAYGGWPAHPAHGRAWHVAGLMSGFALLALVTVTTFGYAWHRTWGSTRAELLMPLPGDPAVRTPALEIQHAVTIAAPPSEVWAWLVQLGQDRAGFYSYDWLERAFGADVHNVGEIRPQWQHRQVGDFVPATQRGYLGGLFGDELGWRVKQLESRTRAGPRELGRVRAPANRRWADAIHHPLDHQQSTDTAVGVGGQLHGFRAAAFHHGAPHDAHDQEALGRPSCDQRRPGPLIASAHEN